MQNQNRHLAAILFTDIVGYTALMQHNEGLALAMVKRYTTVLETTIKAHAGEILNDYGDGSLCAFNSATEAVSCALELQQKLKDEPSVPLRIGLHIGEIFFDNKKVFGDGVNVASRIESLGQANAILFSGEINSKIKNNPGFKSISLGRFDFKNVDDPVEVFALANEGLVVPKKEEMTGKLKEVENKRSTKKIIAVAAIVLLLAIIFAAYKMFSPKNNFAGINKTIAVLPFKNISTNKEENEPFCLGIVLELQKKLEWMGELTTIAPQSVEKFRDTKLSIADIASELGGIKYILQGTVQRDKNKVKVFTSLVDAESGKELWNDNFPGEMEDIFSLQENISQQIAAALQVKITPKEQSRISRVATKNTKALDLYYEAQLSYAKYAYDINPLNADYQKIQTLCNDALSLDSNMAEAYVLKARAYWIANYYKEYLSKNFMDTVALFCNKALAIDKNAEDAYVLLSNYHKETGKSELAFNELSTALSINPNSFFANRELGRTYSDGLYFDPEKSIRYLHKALKLDPLSVWTPAVYNDLAYTYLGICDFEKAKYYATLALRQNNKTRVTLKSLWLLTMLSNRTGKADEALSYAAQLMKLDSSGALYFSAETYCYLKNDCAKAVKLYRELWGKYPHENIHRYAVALWKTDEKEMSLKLMNKSIKQYKKLDSLGRLDFANYDMAGVYAFMGDKKTAYQILKEVEKKEHWAWGMPYLIKVDPLFDNLRNDKEFKDLVQAAIDEKTKMREKIRKMEEQGEL